MNEFDSIIEKTVKLIENGDSLKIELSGKKFVEL